MDVTIPSNPFPLGQYALIKIEPHDNIRNAYKLTYGSFDSIDKWAELRNEMAEYPSSQPNGLPPTLPDKWRFCVLYDNGNIIGDFVTEIDMNGILNRYVYQKDLQELASVDYRKKGLRLLTSDEVYGLTEILKSVDWNHTKWQDFP